MAIAKMQAEALEILRRLVERVILHPAEKGSTRPPKAAFCDRPD